MAAIEIEETSQQQASKVTLTNWKRVANIPFQVDGAVQAVSWCDYIVFLDKKKEMYLYHHKWGIWSAINTKSLHNIADGCPLAVFNQDLILFSERGDVFKFFVGTGHWKVDEALKVEDVNLIPYAIWTALKVVKVVLASTQDRMFLLLQNTKNRSSYLYFKEFSTAKWGDSKKLQHAFLSEYVSHISYAVVQLPLYVSTGTAVYCIDTQQGANSNLTVTQLCSPSLHMSTICTVNDTIFSFGGKDEDDQPNSDVYRYNTTTKEWEPAGYMRSCRYSVTVSTFLKDKDNTDIIVVGGILGENEDPKVTLTCRITEVCEVGVTF